VSGQHHARPRFTPGERAAGTHCTGGWVRFITSDFLLALYLSVRYFLAKFTQNFIENFLKDFY
jgi:hypothetical protein